MRPYLIEKIDDVAVVQVYADGFRSLAVRDTRLVWHLAETRRHTKPFWYSAFGQRDRQLTSAP